MCLNSITLVKITIKIALLVFHKGAEYTKIGACFWESTRLLCCILLLYCHSDGLILVHKKSGFTE